VKSCFLGLRRIFSLKRKDIYQEGVALYNRGLYLEALESFARILGNASPSLSLHCNLATFYSGLCCFNLGILDLYSGDYGLAAEHLEKAIEFTPNRFGPYHYLGIVYNNQGRYTEALGAFGRVQELNPGFLPVKTKLAVVFHNESRLDKARREMERLVVQHPDWADIHYHLGLIYAAQGLHDQALEQLEKALIINPAYVKARISLGSLYSRTGRLQEGLDLLLKVEQDRPDYPDVQYHLGLAHGALGQFEEAAERFRRALKLNPIYTQAMFGLGVVSGALGRAEEAEEIFHRLISLAPNHPEVEFILAHLQRLQAGPPNNPDRPSLTDFWVRTGREMAGRVEIVPDLLEVATVFDPTHDRALYLSLIRMCQATAEHFPHYADVLEGLGILYAKLQIHDRAITAFKKALQVNPGFVRARINLYKNFLALTMDQEALKEIGELLDRGISYPDIFLDQGRALHRLGRDDEAVESLSRTVDLSPDLEPAYRLWAQVEETRGRNRDAVEVMERYLNRPQANPSQEFLFKLEELKG